MYNVRSEGGYQPFKKSGMKFKKSFFPYFSNLWNSLPPSDQSKNLVDFKEFTKLKFKPPKIKHYSRGNKLGNSLLTKIRVGRSDLNQHKFTIGLTENPECSCHFNQESPLHYFLDCFLYLPERQILFEIIEHYIPKFKNLSKQNKLNIILHGIDNENPDILSTNTTITIAVQNFILKSKRFAN